jgi:BMFP domain-containing protein YqiC
MINTIRLQPCGCHEGRDCTMVRQCYVEEMVRVQRVADEAEIETLHDRVAELEAESKKHYAAARGVGGAKVSDKDNLPSALRAISEAFVRGQPMDYRMRIPADAEHDGDLVCAAAACEIEALRARVAELEAENARLREIPCWVESEDGNPGWGKTADAVEMLGKACARIEKLEKIEMVLRDLLDNISTPTLDDPRLDYVEVQVDREALVNARHAIASV